MTNWPNCWQKRNCSSFHPVLRLLMKSPKSQQATTSIRIRRHRPAKICNIGRAFMAIHISQATVKTTTLASLKIAILGPILKTTILTILSLTTLNPITPTTLIIIHPTPTPTIPTTLIIVHPTLTLTTLITLIIHPTLTTIAVRTTIPTPAIALPTARTISIFTEAARHHPRPVITSLTTTGTELTRMLSS
mmetsp:Transcript_38241/g.75289  ORF Transcript_38241/g.75289 Transcript_38241/m.75289 type:complete len:191 (-) Transcript_38241:27-599(-)